MTRRTLRPDELDLWRKVARTTDRLHPNRSDPLPLMAELLDETPQKPRREPVEPFDIGERAQAKSALGGAMAAVSGELVTSGLNMDKRSHDRLKRGKLRPEGRIDLHGMTLDQAHPALNAFIMSSYAKDRRLVLVITGKGKQSEDLGPIPSRPGVLRRTVPHWLQTPPLSQMILQVTQAHARHGGAGAYYVYLRRRR